jgi:hypothetical protein
MCISILHICEDIGKCIQSWVQRISSDTSALKFAVDHCCRKHGGDVEVQAAKFTSQPSHRITELYPFLLHCTELTETRWVEFNRRQGVASSYSYSSYSSAIRPTNCSFSSASA